MACCPRGTFFPEIRDCSGTLRTLMSDETLSVPGLFIDGTKIFPQELLTSDVTIYIDPSGKDSGTGSISSPFKTIFRAAEKYLRFIPDEFTITVHFNPGVHEIDQTFNVVYPYGANLVFEGETETINNPTISNIDGSASTDPDFSGLEFIDFDLDLSGSGAQVGNFVHVTGCTGGTNPQGLNGLHRIESLSSGVATCRVWRNVNTTDLPSGAITVSSITLLKSVLKFTSDAQGIDISGPYHVGELNNIVLEGNADAYASGKRGVRLFLGSTLRSVFGLHIHGWGTAAEVIGGIFYLQSGSISKNESNGIRTDFGGTTRFTSGVFNGIAENVINCRNNSNADMNGAFIQSCGRNSAALSEDGGYVDLSSADIYFDDGASTALFARDLGRINALSANVVGFSTVKSPATNPGSNQAIIIGP